MGSNSRGLGTPVTTISVFPHQDLQIRSFTPTFKTIGFSKKKLLIESKQSIFQLESESSKTLPKIIEPLRNMTSHFSQRPSPCKEKKSLSPLPSKERKYFPARFKAHTKEKLFLNKDLKFFIPSAYSDLKLVKQINKHIIESDLNRVKAAKAYLGSQFSDDFFPCNHSQLGLAS